MRYREKPKTIEAWKITEENVAEMAVRVGGKVVNRQYTRNNIVKGILFGKKAFVGVGDYLVDDPRFDGLVGWEADKFEDAWEGDE